jgi:ribonucleotide reductase beta subunit family protein with ferritin-like domain
MNMSIINYMMNWMHWRGGNSSVSIGTTYRLEALGSIVGMAVFLFLLSRSCLGPSQDSNKWILRDPSLYAKQFGLEADLLASFPQCQHTFRR